MTRIKKSRKPIPGSSSSTPRVSASEKLAIEKSKRPRKKNGNAPGSRQTVATKNSPTSSNSKAQDPRIGSKKPIELIKGEKPKAQAQPQKSAKSLTDLPLAKVRVAAEPDYYQELEAIEEDELLQTILAKQDAEIELTDKEVDHFNTLMERHQELREKLGLDDDEEEEGDIRSTKSKNKLTEDELWEKFNNAQFDDEF